MSRENRGDGSAEMAGTAQRRLAATRESLVPAGSRWRTTGDMMMGGRMGWRGGGSQSCVGKGVGGGWGGVGIEVRLTWGGARPCRAAAEFEVLRFRFEAVAGLETWDSHLAREDTRPTDEEQRWLDGVSPHRLRAVRPPASLTGWGWVPYNTASPSNSNV